MVGIWNAGGAATCGGLGAENRSAARACCRTISPFPKRSAAPTQRLEAPIDVSSPTLNAVRPSPPTTLSFKIPAALLATQHPTKAFSRRLGQNKTLAKLQFFC